MDIRVTRARRIFSDGKHNAFTGIASLAGRTFVGFRSGTTHMTLDGAVRVIASADMEAWDVVAEKRHPEFDLRDAKMVTFKDAVMVFFGARGKTGLQQSMMCKSTEGTHFSDPVVLKGVPPKHWLWCACPCGDVLYGTAYGTDKGEYGVGLYRSGDGQAWEKVTDFPVTGNETFIDFDRAGVLWALVRDDHRGCIPTLCTAEPPYTKFRSVTRLPMRLQGPMLKRLDGGCVIACRQWEPPGRRNLRTDLFWLEDGHELRRIRSLPSGGDTSYAGWLDLGGGRAALSYYSSHEHKMDEPHANDAAFAKDGAHAEHSTPADIFLADISYA
jgi:hypothetical protein